MKCLYTMGLFAVGFQMFAAEPEPFALKFDSKSAPPEAISESLRTEIAPGEFAIRDGENQLLSFWFRKEIPVKASAEQLKNGLTYREIPEGTLIGIVKFEKAFIDFRKQEIAAGVYTLRIAVQPDTGDHKETAPHQDFVLLTPAADDAALEPLELKDLVKRSLKATGGDHPAVMLLYPHFGKEIDAKIAGRDQGVQCLQLKLKVKSDAGESQLGFAIVVAGFSAKR